MRIVRYVVELRGRQIRRPRILVKLSRFSQLRVNDSATGPVARPMHDHDHRELPRMDLQ